MKKILAALVCLCMILTFTGCNNNDGNQVAGFEYYHFETEDMDKALDKLETLADTDKSDKIIKLYDLLYDQCVELDSLYTVSYVKHSTDISDEYYDKEQLYCYKTLVDKEDRLCEICRHITQGPSADSFRQHVGKQAFDTFADYDEMTDREKKLVRQEQKLIEEYYDTYEEIDARGVKCNGTTWTMEDLMGDKGSNLAYSNYDAYLETYYKLTGKFNQATGPIFLKLLKIRVELADINGYDNYADYADEQAFSRDYTGRDLKPLYADVKKIADRYYNNYYSAMSVGMESSYPKLSEKELLKNLEKYSGKVSNLAGKSCRMLLDEKLYNMGNSENRQDSSYTTVIHRTDKPFICQTLNSEDDFAVLTHEFGHFIQYSAVHQNNLLTDFDNIDLAEIASNGYQGLMTHYYDDIFGGEADAATRYALENLLGNVVDGCLMDEFQREVYANPEMNLKEINRTYTEIAAQYDAELKGDPGYNWVFISHNFENPMYYISYTASGLAALQIWNQSQTDFEGAVHTWEKIVKTGSFNKKYLTVMDECDLQKFTETGATLDICGPALKATKVKTEF